MFEESESARFFCSACGREAARIDFGPENGETRSSLTVSGFWGKTTIYGEESALREFFGRISRGELQGRDASEAEFLGFFCRACGKSYCRNCWGSFLTEFDEGFYDYTKATCPQGHEQILDD